MSGNKWEKRFIFDITTDCTHVPNLLLKNFHQIGLTESELIFLLQLLMIGKNSYTSVKEISQVLSCEVVIVKQNLAALIEKGFIVPESVKEPGNTSTSCYFLDGLYEKLIDLWACEMAGRREIAAGAEDKPSASDKDKIFFSIFEAFEKEFGRPLSPIETDKILEWLNKSGYKPEIILESLKRAVLRGVFNFNYIDKILLEWQRSNIRTVNEAVNYEKTKMRKGKNSQKKLTQGHYQTKSLKDLYEN